MPELLEAVMLICFGFSWPLNVYRNIKSHTAKGMSIAFILLIMVGYLAGITAKIVCNNFSYVLAVYFINLAFVSVNLLVYFHNRKLDRQKRCEMAA
ncbi:MAG: hypothetical protein IJX76_01600 [Clostridia bacterium]|nr:hypothetical protein [Clostridia bacterium]